jgi:hypothetical protein
MTPRKKVLRQTRRALKLPPSLHQQLLWPASQSLHRPPTQRMHPLSRRSSPPMHPQLLPRLRRCLWQGLRRRLRQQTQALRR